MATNPVDDRIFFRLCECVSVAPDRTTLVHGGRLLPDRCHDVVLLRRQPHPGVRVGIRRQAHMGAPRGRSEPSRDRRHTTVDVVGERSQGRRVFGRGRGPRPTLRQSWSSELVQQVRVWSTSVSIQSAHCPSRAARPRVTVGVYCYKTSGKYEGWCAISRAQNFARSLFPPPSLRPSHCSPPSPFSPPLPPPQTVHAVQPG